MSFPRYPKYKDSGVEWLGEVPEHWEVKRIRWLVEIKKRIAGGLGYDVLAITQQGVRVKDLDSNDGQLSMDYSKYQIVEIGDFAMNHMDLLTGYVDISRMHGVTSPDYRVFSLRERATCHPNYLLALFQMGYKNKIFYAYGQGSSQLGRWRLPTEEFNNLRFPVPPQIEQQKIAAFLDRETVKIDGLIAEQERLIELLKEKRQAVISHTVTRGLNPNAPMKPSGIEWLGEVPAHWEVKRLKQLAAKITDGEHISPALSAEGILLLSAKDVRDWVIDYDVDKYVSVEDANQYWKRCRPEYGDVLVVSRGATVGRIGVVESDIAFCLMGSVILCKPNEEYDSVFLYYALNARHSQTSLWFSSASSAQQAIYIRDVAEVPVPIPPLAERATIVAFLKTEVAKLDTLTAEAQRAIDLLQERRTALISAAVTGQIDVRGLS